MQPNPGSENERQLRPLLNEWKVDAPLPPRFQESVWRRIAAEAATETANPWRVFARAIERMVLRPVVVAGSLAAFLVMGSLAGWAQGRERVASLDAELSVRYVRSVDPYQMHHP